MTVERRLVSLERTFGPTSPSGCRWVNGRCNVYRTVRVAPDEPAPSDPAPATCPTCGRPTFVRTYILVEDAAEPSAVPVVGA